MTEKMTEYRRNVQIEGFSFGYLTLYRTRKNTKLWAVTFYSS